MYEANLESGEIYLYDAIGDASWGFIDAATVVSDLQQLKGKSVTMRLNSPGGSVDEAKAIYNAIQRHGDVTISVDSLAASAASYIAMAGKRVVMAENALMMIHNSWTFAAGNSTELRKIADLLDKYTEASVSAYAKKAGKDEKEISSLMESETWFNAQEALDYGLVDEIGNVIVEGQPQVPKAMVSEGSIAAQARIATPKAGSRTPYRRMEARAKIYR